MSVGDGVGAENEGPEEQQPIVAVSRTSPDRTVFTEQGNTDGWIATDLTVELDR